MLESFSSFGRQLSIDNPQVECLLLHVVAVLGLNQTSRAGHTDPSTPEPPFFNWFAPKIRKAEDYMDIPTHLYRPIETAR